MVVKHLCLQKKTREALAAPTAVSIDEPAAGREVAEATGLLEEYDALLAGRAPTAGTAPARRDRETSKE